jgi:DNA polymerase III subunit delta
VSGSGEIKPAYLIAGGDQAKIGAALSRLRARAEREGGAGALESFGPADGRGAPDAEALIAALPAMSLIDSRRYLVADRVERWSQSQVQRVAGSLADVPSDTTVVLVSRERAPRKLAEAVERCGGQLLTFEPPKARQLPRWVVAEAEARGFTLERDAARLLVDRLGERTARLASELDRLALWAGPRGEVSVADLDAMVADTSEAMIWSLADAVVERRRADALASAEQLAAQGESVSYLIYGVAGRLRRAIRAVAELEAGRPAREIERELGMSPYAARMLLRSVRDASLPELKAATRAMADLEWWTRGGSSYPDDVALALAVGRAAGGG